MTARLGDAIDLENELCMVRRASASYGKVRTDMDEQTESQVADSVDTDEEVLAEAKKGDDGGSIDNHIGLEVTGR